MATEKQYIDRVRRNVQDFDEPRRYDDDYYKEAIQFALSKLSYDFDESYSTPESVPLDREFLVTKLASIEMCHIRAGEVLTGAGGSDDPDDSNLGIAQLDVPDLKIETQDQTPSDIAGTWLRLAKDLQKEYDGELKQEGGTNRTIQTEYLNAHSYRNGGLANRRLDKGLPAVSIGAVVNSLAVSLSWGAVYHPEFVRYEIRRSTDNFVSEDSQVGSISDNHVVTFEDVVPSIGSYQYKVLTVNPNVIKVPSNILDITVS